MASREARTATNRLSVNENSKWSAPVQEVGNVERQKEEASERHPTGGGNASREPPLPTVVLWRISPRAVGRRVSSPSSAIVGLAVDTVVVDSLVWQYWSDDTECVELL